MRIIQYILLAGIFLLIPSPALAWGPLAHLDFSLSTLANLSLLAPAVAALLKKFPQDFIYGSIAADITVGKSLSPYHLHCHNWQVGFSVLFLSQDDRTRAFAWGYLSHLAADSVAHNYFIPYKMIQSFKRRTAPHVFWEIRYDSWISSETWAQARKLSRSKFKIHDQHLKKILTDPLFSFPVNKRIFNSLLLLNRFSRWRKFIQASDRKNFIPLTEDEFLEMRQESLERIRDLLSQGTSSNCLDADPTGNRNILVAKDIRKKLRVLYKAGKKIDPGEIGSAYRPLFKESIEHKLKLPPLSDLVHPEISLNQSKRTRGVLQSKHSFSRNKKARNEHKKSKRAKKQQKKPTKLKRLLSPKKKPKKKK
jgi:hypothetical protein